LVKAVFDIGEKERQRERERERERGRKEMLWKYWPEIPRMGKFRYWNLFRVFTICP
jgi:hypothetical protein